MPSRKPPAKERSKPAPVKSGAPDGRSFPRLDTAPTISHGEVSGRIEQGGCLRGVVLEAQEDDPRPNYAVFLLSSWRKEYTVLGFNSADRPRLFRDVDRILALVRFEYGFKGTIALRLASDGPPRHHSWRITHGSNISRAAGKKDVLAGSVDRGR